jgi:hypothetical protein
MPAITHVDFDPIYVARIMLVNAGLGLITDLDPDLEVGATLALRQALGPDMPLRIDPDGAWTSATALRPADARYGGVWRGPRARTGSDGCTAARTRHALRHQHVQHLELLTGGKLPIGGGCPQVTREPGLGVTLDPEALARLHQAGLDCGHVDRDDAVEMREKEPDRAFMPVRY